MATAVKRGRPVKSVTQAQDAYEDLRALTDELAETLSQVNEAAVRLALAAGHRHLDIPEEVA